MRRRRLLALLAAAAALPLAAPLAQQQAKVVEARIEKRRVVAPEAAIRVTQGDLVELRWTSDEEAELHLHGYDVKLVVRPGAPAAMRLEAHASGRFPITSHRWGSGGHGHDALTYLEVYPR